MEYLLCANSPFVSLLGLFNVYFVRYSILSKVPDNRQDGSEWRCTKLCFPTHKDGPHLPLGDEPLGVPSLCLHDGAGQG